MAASVTYLTVNGVLLHENRGGVETEYTPDPLGNLIQCRDSAGTKTYEAFYWPYGEVRSETGTNPSPWGFVGLLGYLRDAATLLYVRARYYRPVLSRWQTVDRFWPFESPYGYGDAAPAFTIDPSGNNTGKPNVYETCLDFFCSMKAGVDMATAVKSLFKGISQKIWDQLKKLLQLIDKIRKQTPPPCDPRECMKEIRTGMGLLGALIRAVCKYLKGNAKSLYSCACAATSVDECKECCRSFGYAESGMDSACYTFCDNYEEIQQTHCGDDKVQTGDGNSGTMPGAGCSCR